jgi:hypothetical protein
MHIAHRRSPCEREVIHAVWHGLLQPVEPRTFDEMVQHLATVHLPLYLGALGVLVTTGFALAHRSSRARTMAFLGAAISTVAEAWHAYSHLQMDTHAGPVAGSLSFVGFLVVVVAAWMEGRPRRAWNATSRRRAA